MKIKKVKQEEFDTLLKVMNESFNFVKDNDKFEHILPKLYYKDNTNMTHIGAYENNKLVASIGLYPMTLISKYGTLNVACVGAVSTLPSYRNKGYFSTLIQKIINEGKNCNYDLLFLGGNRVRYGHYGFEYGGISFNFVVSKRSFNKLVNKNYNIKEMENVSLNDIDQCLTLYNNQTQHAKRELNDFVKVLKSWNQIPYVVYVNNNVVGYFTINDNVVNEFIYINEYKDVLIDAILQIKDNVTIRSSIEEYNEDTLNKCDHYYIEHCEMYKIFNYEKVYKYLNITNIDEDKLSKIDEKAKVREILGDGVNMSKNGLNMFIFREDHC